jgi:alkanesulfonate monooxygenase SsuD/methylene tetrahydromethanopterin reductase-like flavin-dependent oxidoreductase (luciferase family)
LRSLGVLVTGRAGDAAALRLVELAERLGLDSVWLTDPQPDSAAGLLTRAVERTSRIALGTTSLPLGTAAPARLAAELTALDHRSGARLNPGFGLGPADASPPAASPSPSDESPFDADAQRLLDALHSPRPGLARRLWCAADSLPAARWAGGQGLNLFAAGEGEEQLARLRAFRESHPSGAWARVCRRVLVLPIDSATPAQRARYQEFAALHPVGPAAELAARLTGDAVFAEVEEAAFVVPDGLAPEDQAQLLTDLAGRLGPALGWQPGY